MNFLKLTPLALVLLLKLVATSRRIQYSELNSWSTLAGTHHTGKDNKKRPISRFSPLYQTNASNRTQVSSTLGHKVDRTETPKRGTYSRLLAPACTASDRNSATLLRSMLGISRPRHGRPGLLRGLHTIQLMLITARRERDPDGVCHGTWGPMRSKEREQRKS